MQVPVTGRRSAACALALAALATISTTGCTLYSEQKAPTLAMTTSAEQVDRIFWQDVTQAKWTEVNALLAPNVIWRVNGEIVPRAQIVSWLQSLDVHGVQVTNVALTPAVNDMNLVYTVQVQADKAIAAQVSASCAGKPQTLNALAVWQQPQPTSKSQKNKQYRGYLLTVHDLTAMGDGGCH
jgi:formaldehyde-activating enzyme involved in methanogenesis